MALDGVEQIPITRRCEILISAVIFTPGASFIGPLAVVINGQRTRHSATTAKGRETATIIRLSIGNQVSELQVHLRGWLRNGSEVTT